MRAKPIPIEKQYQLVLECRQSGLSDYNWCLEHDIKPGTFYSPVPSGKRLAPVRSGAFQDDHCKLDHKLRGPVLYPFIRIFPPGTPEKGIPDGR